MAETPQTGPWQPDMEEMALSLALPDGRGTTLYLQALECLLGMAELPPIASPDTYQAQLLARLERAVSAVSSEPHAALVMLRPWQTLCTTPLAHRLQDIESAGTTSGPQDPAHGADRPLGPTRTALAGTASQDALLTDPDTARPLHVTALPLTGASDPAMQPGERQILGALILYRPESPPLQPRAQRFLHAIALAASLHLRSRAAQQTREQLEQALASRVLIEQAKGMLAERWDCTPAAAFAALRAYARHHQYRIHDLAERVLDGTEDPPAPHPTED